MGIPLFLMLGVAAVALASAQKSTNRLRSKLVKKAPAKRLHLTLTALILTAQVSELVKMIEHLSVVTVVSALFVLALALATTSGTEGELH